MHQTVILTVILALLIAAAIFYFMKTKKSVQEVAPTPEPEPEKKKGIIYGSMTCPYTVKQINKHPEFDYVDCKTGKCPDFVGAFPTTVYPDGSIVPGYKA